MNKCLGAHFEYGKFLDVFSALARNTGENEFPVNSELMIVDQGSTK